MAAEHRIDLSQVPGTGQGGRITKMDVQAYLERLKGEGLKVESERAAALTPALGTPVVPQTGQSPLTPHDRLIPMTAIRRSIAEHMVHSKHTSPHVTTVMEADMSRVAAHREANKAIFARDGVNLTYTAYLIAASVTALKAFPIVNSSWSETGVVLHRPINIGMATSLGEDGLIVPVIKNADGLSLLGLARTINDLADRARAKKLQPDEVKGGTFTLTNHGTSGSLFATPIINQPQCAILGAGIIQRRVVVINDAIAIRPMVYVSLTFDHRILDGASADHFLAKMVEVLQSWG
jgi:2-oxoglutarate dehydrogenase E2 component (dihydrolipoamide succinyltransferase)